jgi:hypothetical protein
MDVRALNTIWLCLEDDVLFNIIGEETITWLMEKNGETLYEKILDKLNLIEEAIVQFMNEGRYQNC